MQIKNIAIGSDHAGFDMKQLVIEYLTTLHIPVKDFGTYGESAVDYPDYGHPVANAVENKEVDFGIVLCGSGNGIAMTVNKHQGIRCALCWTAEIATLSRLHNDANILAIPARFVDKALALDMVKTFIQTNFEGGRHQTRVDKIHL